LLQHGFDFLVVIMASAQFPAQLLLRMLTPCEKIHRHIAQTPTFPFFTHNIFPSDSDPVEKISRGGAEAAESAEEDEGNDNRIGNLNEYWMTHKQPLRPLRAPRLCENLFGLS
jgi:hypothetical protein